MISEKITKFQELVGFGIHGSLMIFYGSLCVSFFRYFLDGTGSFLEAQTGMTQPSSRPCACRRHI